MDLVEDTGSTIIIKNNRFQGVIGPALEQAFGNDNYCLLQGNNVQNVTDIGILLGPEISGCTVVGGNNKTNVLDLGTGVGPEIQTLLKIMK